MKQLLITITLFISLSTQAQNIEKKVNLGCSPKTGTNRILYKPEKSAIHSAYISEYKGGGSLGTSWSFMASKMITTPQGKFLYGDIYSPRGSKMNVKQNGYNGPVFVYYDDWDCQ